MAECKQDMLYKDYTINPIPTSILYTQFEAKNDVGMGLLV